MKNRKLNLILVLPIIIFTLSVLNCNRAELSENSILPIKNSASNNSTQIFDSVQSNTNQIADSIQTNINKPLNNSKNLLFLKEWIGKYPINKGDKNFANFFTVPQVKSLLTEIVGKDGFQNMLNHFVASDQIKAKKDFLEVSGTSIRKVTQDVDYGMIAINLKTGETHVFFVDNEKLSGFSNVKGNGNLPLAVKADILPYTGQAELIGTTTQKSGDGYGCYAVEYSIRDTPQETKPSIFYLTDEGGIRADDGVMNIEGKDVLLKMKTQTERKNENGKTYIDWVYENKDVRAHFEMSISEIPDSSAVVYEGTVIVSSFTKMQSVPIKVFCGG